MKHPPVDQLAVEQTALPITVEGTPLAAPNTTEVGRVAREPQFKPYTMDQLFLPMDFGDMIPPHHPKLMTKILVYAYTQRSYSSRQIAKAVREQIPFLWLTGRQTPDFRTIHRFRGERMKAIVDEVLFTGILTLWIEEGLCHPGWPFCRWHQGRGQCQPIPLWVEEKRGRA